MNTMIVRLNHKRFNNRRSKQFETSFFRSLNLLLIFLVRRALPPKSAVLLNVQPASAFLPPLHFFLVFLLLSVLGFHLWKRKSLRGARSCQ